VLDEAAVREIRRLHASTVWGYRTLAELYGVSRSTIMDIVAYRTWAWVDDSAPEPFCTCKWDYDRDACLAHADEPADLELQAVAHIVQEWIQAGIETTDEPVRLAALAVDRLVRDGYTRPEVKP
jgi:hypothetical protein